MAGMDFFLKRPVYKSGMEKLLNSIGLYKSSHKDQRAKKTKIDEKKIKKR